MCKILDATSTTTEGEIMSAALSSTKLPAISEESPLNAQSVKYLTKEQRDAIDKAAAAFIETLQTGHDKLAAQKEKMAALKRE